MSPPGDIAEADPEPLGGTAGQTGRGSPGYFGPCPPSGEHRYVFDVYALDTTLTLTADQATKAALLDAMRDHTLQQSTLTGRYGRGAPTAEPTTG
jgi:Raf kinase inhibitor-like YbhB/YbcL family protein